jgi:Uma2 family endonuclease
MAWVNTSPLVKTYTLKEFWELPEAPDHSKVELIAGVLYMTPPPGYLHNNAVSRLIRLFSDYLTKTGDKGRLLVPRAAIWTSPNTYLEPDLFYVSEETESRLDPKYPTTADLVVEVISPGSAIYDRNTKADTYAALGVKEVWLVDEDGQSLEIRELEGLRRVFSESEIVTSAVLPGLSFPLRSLFED